MPGLFRTLSWGILLVILDIRIFGFDLLPDPAGFIMIFNALVKLSRQIGFSSEVRKLYWWSACTSLVLLPFSIAEFFRVLFYGEHRPVSVGWLVVDGLTLLLMLALIYFFVTAMQLQAARDSYSDLADTARFRKWFACSLMLLMLLITPFGLNEAEIAGLQIVISILAFASQILILLLCRRAANLYERPRE
ncbi:hypothetical protein [Paenibacillus senegalensis]|uniref:hypothetical protein n=1 Tax=Paenibacillus senegalensis TaxID=1465766 RepID=UPI000289B07E|nr:hypothetical protein [Paenibacillus senegalensis]